MEENGGGEGNSSVAELEVRVEALEGIVVVHDIRITSKNTNKLSLNMPLQNKVIMEYINKKYNM